MTEINVKMNAQLSPELAAILSELDSIDVRSLPEALQERLKSFLYVAEPLEKLVSVEVDVDSADAGHGAAVVVLNPTEAFRVLMSALRTGDADLLGVIEAH